MSKIEYVKYEKDLCFKCLQRKRAINIYELKGRGYGSIYDNDDTRLQLCNECVGSMGNNNELEKWFNEKPKIVDHVEEYQYESNIKQYIEKLPIQGREIFENQLSNTWVEDSQIWIDRELGLIKEEVDFDNSWMDEIKDCTYERIKLNKDDILAMRYPVDECGDTMLDFKIIRAYRNQAKELFPNNKIWVIPENMKFMTISKIRGRYLNMTNEEIMRTFIGLVAIQIISLIIMILIVTKIWS